MVKTNFENILHKGMKMERQVSSLERSSGGSDGTNGWTSHRSFRINTNQNSETKKNTPATGDTLLFIIQQNQLPQQVVYLAYGFPGFTLDKRTLVDLSSSSSWQPDQPTFIIGKASRVTTDTTNSSSLEEFTISGQVYVDIRCTFD